MFAHQTLINEMDKLRKVAVRLTGGRSCDAEDLLQSTILRALEKKHLFVEGTNLSAWMTRIMFNLFVSQYHRKTKFESVCAPEDLVEHEATAPEQEILTDFSAVGTAMRQLSAEHQDILIAVCVYGRRYEEVASQLSVPVGTIRSRLSRAREHLKTLLEAPVSVKNRIPPLPREQLAAA